MAVTTSIAIIGTAGRGEDKGYLTPAHYRQMLHMCLNLFRQLKVPLSTAQLYSGGAAWSDHLVVTLALEGYINPNRVTLFLPTDINDQGFFGSNEFAQKIAGVANYYHRSFSACLGIDSIQEINELGKRGGTLIPGKGNFFQRNSQVAKAVDDNGILIAFTFGNELFKDRAWEMIHCGRALAGPSGLKDGGTADTWNKTKTDRKYHCVIGIEPSSKEKDLNDVNG